MTKKLKSIIVLTLAFAMCLALNSTAFAAESTTPEGIPEYATRHEMQLTLFPEGYEGDEATTDGMQSYIWGNPSMNLIYHHTASTSSFYVSDRYFAYEMEAIPIDGVPTTQGYYVAFKPQAGGIKASMSGYADGSNYKLDWIDIYTDGNYYFEVTNNTDYILSINIIYYSWN